MNLGFDKDERSKGGGGGGGQTKGGGLLSLLCCSFLLHNKVVLLTDLLLFLKKNSCNKNDQQRGRRASLVEQCFETSTLFFHCLWGVMLCDVSSVQKKNSFLSCVTRLVRVWMRFSFFLKRFQKSGGWIGQTPPSLHVLLL